MLDNSIHLSLARCNACNHHLPAEQLMFNDVRLPRQGLASPQPRPASQRPQPWLLPLRGNRRAETLSTRRYDAGRLISSHALQLRPSPTQTRHCTPRQQEWCPPRHLPLQPMLQSQRCETPAATWCSQTREPRKCGSCPLWTSAPACAAFWCCTRPSLRAQQMATLAWPAGPRPRCYTWVQGWQMAWPTCTTRGAPGRRL